MGIDSGMVMTCGKADIAIGPNNGCSAGLDVASPGDPDLTILAGVITYDKCVLEFDFIPLSDTIRFKYVFGSEELFAWCYQYNDPFGFFLSGPGINGTFSNYSTDIALMPDSSGYVTIDNICSDPSSRWCNAPLICGPSSMCNNSPSNSGLYYQYNAMTYVFTAWHKVQPCSTYHIKIAIADAKDHILDSGVFLEKGSFSSASISGPSQACVNSSGNVYTTQAGMLNYQWTVSQGGTITSGGTSTSNTVTVTWNTTGLQTVGVSYTNTGGCSSPFPTLFNVTVMPLPNPSITGTSLVCVNSAGNNYLTQPGMNNYIWTVSSGGTITAGGTSASDSVTITWNNPGIQTVTVNYTDNNGCTGANPAIDSVNVLPLPVPALTGPVFPCIDSAWNIYLTQAGISNYLWYVSPGGSILAGGTSSDNYVRVRWNTLGIQIVTVNYTDADGCTALNPTQLIVTVQPLPVPTIEGQSSSCLFSADNIYTTEPGMNTYTWNISPGGITTGGFGTNSITVTWNVPGQQSVNVIYANQNGCRAGSPAYFNVTVNPLPDPAGTIVGPSQLCSGTNGLIYSVPPINNASGYFWTLPSGFFVLSGNGSNSIVVDVADDAVSGIITVSGNDLCGNGSTSPPFQVMVNHRAIADAGPDQVTCAGMTVTVSQASATNYSSIHWFSNGTGTLADSTTLTPAYTPGPSDTGTVVLTLIVTGNAPCRNDTSRMNLNILRKATVNAGEDQTSCGMLPVVISGSSANNYSSLLWTTSGSGTFDDPASIHAIYIPLASDVTSGYIVLTLLAYSTPPCDTASDTMILTLEQVPEASPGPDGNICQGMSFTIHGAGIDHSSGFTWEDNGRGELKDTGTLNPTYIPAPDELGAVQLKLNASGISACHDSSVSCNMKIFIYPVPEVIAGMDQSIKYGSSTTLTCETSAGSGSFQYVWNPASLLVDNSVQKPQTVNLVKDTVFFITVIDNVTGCEASDHTRVKVGKEEGNEDCIVIHNVITPNGDGVNDKWEIDCIELFPENKVELFNRWGAIVNVFENYNNTDIVWKGTNINGDILPDGTYFYMVQIKNGPTFKGWVFLRSGAK